MNWKYRIEEEETEKERKTIMEKLENDKGRRGKREVEIE